ncbi:MAG: hypothetical protein CFE34_12515 [Rhodobacteraceae bacterium PARR1]|nr:MAG: hypothetical protein CFE34_12515 [Rhodobacteraceae bacterium PARR1]
MTADVQPVQVTYRADAAALFPLALGTGLLSVVTLGIYRFWAKARIRRFVWSQIRVGDDALEFTGTGLEMFLGFLLAVVVLAVYLAGIQLLLFFFGIRFIFAPETPLEEAMQAGSIGLSFLAAVPLMLVALYRARRYRMNRTRLRGIRFGMENAGLGYMIRALVYGVLAVVSLGILWPLMTYRLEAYMTDRSHWGSARFRQGGAWGGLYAALRPYLIGLGFLLVGAVFLALGEAWFGGVVVAMGTIWALFGMALYQTRAFGYLTSHKSLILPGPAAPMHFGAAPRGGRVIWLYIKGGFIVLLLASVASGMLFGAVGMMSAQILGFGGEPSAFAIAEVAVIGAVAYLVFLSVFGTLSLVFISQPILGYLAGSVQVFVPTGFLDALHQARAEVGADADGFADALDIGGAF